MPRLEEGRDNLVVIESARMRGLAGAKVVYLYYRESIHEAEENYRDYRSSDCSATRVECLKVEKWNIVDGLRLVEDCTPHSCSQYH